MALLLTAETRSRRGSFDDTSSYRASSSPPHREHLPPSPRAFRPNPDDVLLDEDVRLPAVLRDEVASLSGGGGLVSAETADLTDELQEFLDLLRASLEWRDDLEGVVGRFLQSTMKWSLRKSFLLFFQPCLGMCYLTYLQTENLCWLWRRCGGCRGCEEDHHRACALGPPRTTA